MDINTETVILPPPDENEVYAERKKEVLKRICFFFSLLLILTSLSVHICIGVSALQSGDDVREAFLLSLILPSFTGSEAFSEEEITEIHIPEKNTDTSVESPTPQTEKSSVSANLSAPFPSLKNETSYNPDLEVLFNSPDPIEKADKLYEKYFEDEPLVLIYHTHATESYLDTNDTGSYRSHDPERNMIAIGKVICDMLKEHGVVSLHATEMFDLKSYNAAYSNSAAAVEELMEKYPSLQYAIDVHRDSITDRDGNCISADYEYNGEIASQLMFVCGTDEGGSGHTEWRKNLTTVLHLGNIMKDRFPSSLRPINLRRASFYQDKTPGAMLLEIGSTGNTMAEAKRAAEHFAVCLAEYVTGKAPQPSDGT